MKRIITLVAIMAISITTIAFSTHPARAQEQVAVHGVLFINPGCGHCQNVLKTDLPALQEKYTDQLQILIVDITQDDGHSLYITAAEQYDVRSHGVPILFIGTTTLSGDVQIPNELPGYIETGLAQGGIPWPDINGLQDYLASHQVTPTPVPVLMMVPDNVATPTPLSYPQPNTVYLPLGENASTPYPAQDSRPANENNSQAKLYPSPEVTEAAPILQTKPKSTWERMADKFKRDPIANTLAVILLFVMIASLVIILVVVLRSALAETPTPPRQYPSWLKYAIPVVAVLGLGVAGYLSYIELTETSAVCGPVGHCNTVQQSSYAKLFGILPIGVFGMAGCIAVLTAWLVQQLGPRKIRRLAGLALWGMAFFGVAFSIYLTFLEPFVIGATCMWCLSSAVVMTALLWLTTPAVVEGLALTVAEDEEESGTGTDVQP